MASSRGISPHEISIFWTVGGGGRGGEAMQCAISHNFASLLSFQACAGWRHFERQFFQLVPAGVIW